MKRTLITFSALSTLMLTTATYADAMLQNAPFDANAPTTSSQTALLTQIANELSSMPASITNGVTAGITKGLADAQSGLEQFLQALYLKAINFVTTNNHQSTPNLSQTTALNSVTISSTKTDTSDQSKPVALTPMKYAAQQASTLTANSTTNSLLEFFYSLNQAGTSIIKSADGSPYTTYISNYGESALISSPAAQASDSLLILSSSASPPNPNFAKLYESANNISFTNNAQFDFSNLLGKYHYTQPEQKSAESFINYATLATKSLLGNISFQSLYNNPKALSGLLTDQTYISFMLKVRNIIAIRSISLYALNQLVQERVANTTLGPVIGKKEASPLEVEEYRATHDVDNPAWYATLENEEPATIQRQMLVALKEIQRQNFQRQLQNEQIISLLAGLNLQGMSSADTALQLSREKLEAAIKGRMTSNAKTNTNDEKAAASALANTNEANDLKNNKNFDFNNITKNKNNSINNNNQNNGNNNSTNNLNPNTTNNNNNNTPNNFNPNTINNNNTNPPTNTQNNSSIPNNPNMPQQ